MGLALPLLFKCTVFYKLFGFIFSAKSVVLGYILAAFDVLHRTLLYIPMYLNQKIKTFSFLNYPVCPRDSFTFPGGLLILPGCYSTGTGLCELPWFLNTPLNSVARGACFSYKPLRVIFIKKGLRANPLGQCRKNLLGFCGLNETKLVLLIKMGFRTVICL